jgi:alkaline phosphatase D
VPTRRQFVHGAGAVVVGLAVAPGALANGGTAAAPLARGGRFRQGVMSGEPTPGGITLWSRLDGVEQRVGVDLEVARDREFRDVVARRRLTTGPSGDGTVKGRVGGLRAHEQYWYRFSTRTTDSPVGRFRTALPPDSRQPVRFAFFSCQDWTHGFYNAHAVMAREDVDFVVNLGDYVYAETYHSRAGGTGVRDDRIGRAYDGPADIVPFLRQARTLAHYRAKYNLYRGDADLRRMHAAFPMVSIWDDHEVVDNYAGAPRDGGLPDFRRYSRARRAAAYRAFFEHMPVSPRGARSRIYRSLRFGRTVELFLTDQRQYRDDQPCGDGIVPPCAGWDRPRDLLGRRQMRWLKGALERSPAAWKVMANQVTIMPTRVLGGALFTYDTWQGYPREREELLAHIADRRIRDVVFVTGDIHTFLAGDVRRQMGEGPPVALEFAGGSITSVGLGELDLPAGGGVVIEGDDRNPRTDPALIEALRAINPWVDAADFDHHGYGVVSASSRELDVRFRRVSTIKRRTRALEPLDPFRWRVRRGQRSIVGAAG